MSSHSEDQRVSGDVITPTGDEPKMLLKGFLPIILLLLLFLVLQLMKAFSPDAERRPPPPPKPLTVEVLELAAQDFQIVVESYGTVQPRTRSRLVAQVAGQVTHVSRNLREGAFFDAGDVLLNIDDRDYLANVKIAEAAALDAQQALAQEQARSQQALADWNRLGNEGAAPDLVLRKPQLEAAKARVESAKSSLEIARLNLERTEVRAPFAGRVLEQMVDVGQVVGNNASIAEIYATDTIEIRLPLRDRDLEFVNLPEQYRSNEANQSGPYPVTLTSSLVKDSSWLGSIVRTESAIDSAARQLHCVAQIEDPFGEMATGRTPLKIGEYVTAQIQGKLIPEAIVVPVSAIYQSTYAYVVEESVLQRRVVDIAWQNDSVALIRAGLLAGDQVILTPLGQVTSGTPVRIEGQDNDYGESGKRERAQRAAPDADQANQKLNKPQEAHTVESSS